MTKHRQSVPLSQTAARLGLGGFMTAAGLSHLTVARREFRAQVPSWVPLPADLVVLGSVVAEIGLGAALLALPGQRRLTGTARRPRSRCGAGPAAFRNPVRH